MSRLPNLVVFTRERHDVGRDSVGSVGDGSYGEVEKIDHGIVDSHVQVEDTRLRFVEDNVSEVVGKVFEKRRSTISRIKSTPMVVSPVGMLGDSDVGNEL